MEVKKARIKKGLTQAQLCKIVKTSPKKLVAIERGDYGNVTKSLMERISTALDSTVKDLFFNEEN
ncbi:helix-turn-helix transcriptional regulator [Clostridium kluyveri]|uniref:helix-turn-helix transcriptional regulator n=1 Tax=Clostridium kluyveri TaxID=1534 RepID=UPI0002DF21FE|nr:helix-turn-helix domain-containing protein [Clostridium kluyveri]